MTTRQRFREHLAYLEASAPPPELLPERLASCCYEVLPIAAAAISLLTGDGFRFPVGASCPRVAYAERLHFTTGEGPALDAKGQGAHVIADAETVARCWPRFHADLVRHTPYRAVAAFPLSKGDTVWATVDLFFTSDEALRRMSVPDAEAIVDLIGSLLSSAPGQLDMWVDSPISAARHITRTAVSLLTTTTDDLTAEESLAAMRAYAAAAGMTVDAVADAVVTQRVPLHDVLPVGASRRSVHHPEPDRSAPGCR